MIFDLSKSFLVKLEKLLKQHHLWSQQPPSEVAMASTAPFACDSMNFEEWLQFIFIPKMTLLIEHKQPLPVNMAIAPMAKHVWLSIPERNDLIVLLTQFDQLLAQNHRVNV
ncbi:YqcC family protein [Shewanella aestuarii]|uniref:YqcC family protein n=1 Tax=Shewanella aestuarii TaxID=1028752 RepID=A0A6G9QLN7_9GAMM|nr:YqcC family protein [Shewanella aestuarii]QIR14957.1 YqcC family protein [Shewanella aestuarii]